jgi:hypothetical protein
VFDREVADNPQIRAFRRALYVGVGRVTESVQSLSEFKLDDVPCLDVLKTADRLRGSREYSRAQLNFPCPHH